MEINRNCFNFIRVIAALQVFVGHACEHLELLLPDWGHKLLGCFNGVPVFFILSGFLIWDSLDRSKSFRSFCVKRLSRIYPELWGGVLLNAGIMIMVYGEKIEWKSFAIFQITQSTMLQFWTPGSLREYGVGTPNGALWTIGVMVQCYLVLWVLHAWSCKNKRLLLKMICLIGVLLNLALPMVESYVPIILYKLLMQTFLPYIWIFLVGALVREYFENIIEYLAKGWFVLFLMSVILQLSGLEYGIGRYATLNSLFLGLAIIGFAYRYHNITIKRDFSYGFYIYHMVVINLMVELNFGKNIYGLVCAFVLTGILAVMSYFVIGTLSKKLKEKYT